MKTTALAEQLDKYRNTADGNDAVFRHFTEGTATNPMLANHRAHIEEHKLGFGDPAFHYMWLLLLQSAAEKFPKIRCLEIGVFKGQVVSLWALITRELKLSTEITAITPLRGNPITVSRFWRAIRYRLDTNFREQVNNGNFYPADDYEGAIRSLFSHFELNFKEIHFVREFSNSPATLSELKESMFELVYVDGDHTYDGVVADLENFGPKVTKGGWLVVDDASYYLPGTAYWKGHEAVSRACVRLDDLGFTNVLNVGHNRVFERTG